MMGSHMDRGDRYYKILNTLSGKAQDEIVGFLNWVFESPFASKIYKLLLGCDDPSPIIDELWFYYITGMEPDNSPTFKEFSIKYLLLSVATNFQSKDNDLSKKALFVGNVEIKKRPIEELQE